MDDSQMMFEHNTIDITVKLLLVSSECLSFTKDGVFALCGYKYLCALARPRAAENQYKRYKME